jgi:hypothetical protein
MCQHVSSSLAIGLHLFATVNEWCHHFWWSSRRWETTNCSSLMQEIPGVSVQWSGSSHDRQHNHGPMLQYYLRMYSNRQMRAQTGFWWRGAVGSHHCTALLHWWSRWQEVNNKTQKGVRHHGPWNIELTMTPRGAGAVLWQSLCYQARHFIGSCYWVRLG